MGVAASDGLRKGVYGTPNHRSPQPEAENKSKHLSSTRTTCVTLPSSMETPRLTLQGSHEPVQSTCASYTFRGRPTIGLGARSCTRTRWRLKLSESDSVGVYGSCLNPDITSIRGGNVSCIRLPMSRRVLPRVVQRYHPARTADNAGRNNRVMLSNWNSVWNSKTTQRYGPGPISHATGYLLSPAQFRPFTPEYTLLHFPFSRDNLTAISCCYRI